MKIATRQSLMAIATLWYVFFGLIFFAMLVTSWQYGFDELLAMLGRMHPVGWLVIAAAFAPGPLAHWFALRLRE